MSGIKRMIVILFLLLVMAAMTYSQTPVRVNGSEGMALLQSLTKSSLNLNNTSPNAYQQLDKPERAQKRL